MQEPISISLRCRRISGEHFLGRREATIGNESLACNEKCPCLKTILQGTTANATLPPPSRFIKWGSNNQCCEWQETVNRNRYIHMSESQRNCQLIDAVIGANCAKTRTRKKSLTQSHKEGIKKSILFSSGPFCKNLLKRTVSQIFALFSSHSVFIKQIY